MFKVVPEGQTGSIADMEKWQEYTCKMLLKGLEKWWHDKELSERENFVWFWSPTSKPGENEMMFEFDTVAMTQTRIHFDEFGNIIRGTVRKIRRFEEEFRD